MSEKMNYLDLFSGIQPAALLSVPTWPGCASMRTTSARLTRGRLICTNVGFPTRYRWVTSGG